MSGVIFDGVVFLPALLSILSSAIFSSVKL
jgi:hypothetical protein